MTEDEKRVKSREYQRRWREAHPEYASNYMRKYREEHREEWNRKCRDYQRKHKAEQQKRMNDYHSTKEGRATNLLNAYIQMDVERGRRKPDLTQDDIMRKCFGDDCKCVYCGETSWRKLGLDRINNDEPHDAINTVCACHDCNVHRYRKNFGEYIKQIGFETVEDWMEFVGATYGPESLTIKYPEN